MTGGGSTGTVAWVDCSAGVAGDMLLGALLDAGADLERVRAAVRSVDPVLDVTVAATSRHGIAATKATVLDTTTGRAADDPGDHHHAHRDRGHPDHDQTAHDHHHHDHNHAGDHEHHHHDHHHHDHPHGHHHHDDAGSAGGHDHPHEHTRTWRQVRELLDAAELDERTRGIAHGVFARLARAEGGVHGVDPDEVTFHEVGALDAIGDVVGCARAWADLGIERAHASVVTVGGGEQTVGQHGRIPLPGPAVVRLAREAAMPTVGGPVTMEMTTPTGAALLAELVEGYGPIPAMVVERVGCGAGTRDPHRLANLTRVLIGQPAADTAAARSERSGTEPAVVLECNVDDLDPRLWPSVITALLGAGAADAWTTPIVMKKGRPATTLSVLCSPARRDTMIDIVLQHTTTLGLRETAVTKHVLDRHIETVEVLGHPVRVKVAERRGVVINVQPEYEDLAAVAAAEQRPLKQVQALANAAAIGLWERSATILR